MLTISRSTQTHPSTTHTTTPTAEAGNLVFMSSLAMNGEGRGIVVRTGDATMIGKIATLASDTGAHRSTLQVEVHRLVWFVGVLAFTMGIILFVIGVARRMNPLGAFVNGFILVVVANVPEGLPATVTSLLTLTALRLRDRNVLIKRTDIIENLGVATIIASDKTGTLTQNRMSVGNVWANQELHEGAYYAPPPRAPEASIERASLLARLSRLSRLSRVSRGPGAGTRRASLEMARAGEGAGGGAGGVARSSVQLGRTSRAAGTLGRSSVTNLAASMALGRVSRMRGDGTFELSAAPPPAGGAAPHMGSLQEGAVASGAAAAAPPAPAAVSPLTLQTFASPEAVTWPGSSALTQLLTVATVCNKAKYDDAAAAAAAANGGATSGGGAAAGERSQGGRSSGGGSAAAAAAAVPTFRGDPDDRKMLGDATDCGALRALFCFVWAGRGGQEAGALLHSRLTLEATIIP